MLTLSISLVKRDTENKFKLFALVSYDLSVLMNNLFQHNKALIYKVWGVAEWFNECEIGYGLTVTRFKSNLTPIGDFGPTY